MGLVAWNFLIAIIKVIFFACLGFLGILAGKKFRDSRELKKKK